MTETPVVLCVDVEPDERYPAPGKATWRGYDRVWDVLRAERPCFAEATGAPVHWAWFLRMDPQTRSTAGAADAAARRAPERLDAMRSAGDSIGVHAHANRFEGGGWSIDHADAGLVEEAVTCSLETFRRATGEGCRAFRFGVRWMDARTMRLLDSLGVRFDLSIEAGRFGLPAGMGDVPVRGTWPDARRTPRRAYRPSFDDPAREDASRTSGIVEIPVATAPRGGWWTRARRAVRDRVAPSLSRDRRLTLDLGLPPPLFAGALERVLAAKTSPIVLSTRTSDNPPEMPSWTSENLAAIRRHPAARRLRFSTPEEAVAASAR